MKKEWWAFVPGHESYMASTLGRIISLDYKHTGKLGLVIGDTYITPSGQKRNRVALDGVRKHRAIWIALTFIPNPNNLPQVNHKDENPENNCVENLEWCTAEYNINYGTRNKRVSEKLTNGSKRSKMVAQYTLDGKLVKVWPSLREIQRKLGFEKASISRCCLGKQHTSYDYIWVYKEPTPSE